MFNHLDKKIEGLFFHNLHKRQQHYVDKSLNKFIQIHPGVDNKTLIELNQKLISEIHRVYDIADKSVLHAGIRRAKFTFWLTAVITFVAALSVVLLTSGAAVALILPALSAVVSWLATVATIPINYTERIQGGMDSVVHAMELEMAQEQEIHQFMALNEDSLTQLGEEVAGLLVNKFSQDKATSDYQEDELLHFLNQACPPAVKQDVEMTFQEILGSPRAEKINATTPLFELVTDTPKVTPSNDASTKEMLVKISHQLTNYNQQCKAINLKLDYICKAVSKEKALALPTKPVSQSMDLTLFNPRQHLLKKFSFHRHRQEGIISASQPLAAAFSKLNGKRS